MAAKSDIEWTDASWTPIRAINLATGKVGWHCEHATTGCEFCYAEGMNKRLGTGLPFKPGHRKDVEIFLDEEMLLAPLRWKKPRMIFVCSMTDAFADFVTDEWLDKMIAVMALCPQHTFQVLTKRAERMREYLCGKKVQARVAIEAIAFIGVGCGSMSDWDGAAIDQGRGHPPHWPLPNVWLGVSCERQEEGDERIPQLLQTPAAVRFVSLEPLLGPIDLCNLPSVSGIGRYLDALSDAGSKFSDIPHRLDWIIVGGESGKSARPMHPQWARDLRDQCDAAGVAFFFKQWGEWSPCDSINVCRAHALCGLIASPPHIERDWTRALDFLRKSKGVAGCDVASRVGKKAAGRLLDGREHNAFPVIDSAVTPSGSAVVESKESHPA